MIEKLENQTIFRCVFCKKKMLSPNGVKFHKKNCYLVKAAKCTHEIERPISYDTLFDPDCAYEDYATCGLCQFRSVESEFPESGLIDKNLEAMILSLIEK